MRLEAFSHIIETMLTDTADVYHYVPTVGADSTTNNSREQTPSLALEPCRISFIKLDSPSNDGDAQLVMVVPKLFFSTTSDIREGDYVVVTRVLDNGKTEVYQGQLGLPSLFASHQEALMLHWGRA